MKRDEDLEDRDLDVCLARLARRTEGLDAAPALDDAVMATALAGATKAVQAGDPLDAALERASRATDAITPTPALVDAVMSERIAGLAASRRRPGAAHGAADVAEGVARSGPWAVVLAGVAAAAVALLSLQAEQRIAGDLVATIDGAEIAP